MNDYSQMLMSAGASSCDSTTTCSHSEDSKYSLSGRMAISKDEGDSRCEYDEGLLNMVKHEVKEEPVEDFKDFRVKEEPAELKNDVDFDDIRNIQNIHVNEMFDMEELLEMMGQRSPRNTTDVVGFHEPNGALSPPWYKNEPHNQDNRGLSAYYDHRQDTSTGATADYGFGFSMPEQPKDDHDGFQGLDNMWFDEQPENLDTRQYGYGDIPVDYGFDFLMPGRPEDSNFALQELGFDLGPDLGV